MLTVETWAEIPQQARSDRNGFPSRPAERLKHTSFI
jgi:hypothetical protein